MQQSVWLKLTMRESIPSHWYPFKVYLPHLFSNSYLVNLVENLVCSSSVWSSPIICGFSLKTLLVPEVLFSKQKSKANCFEISWYRNFWIFFPLPSSLKTFVVFFSRYDQIQLFQSLYSQILVRFARTQNPAPLNFWGIVPGPEFINWNNLEGVFSQSIAPPCRKVNSLLWVILLVFACLLPCSAAVLFITLLLCRPSPFYFVLILWLFPPTALCTVKKKKKAFGIRMESL